jgi:hypothetical protein
MGVPYVHLAMTLISNPVSGNDPPTPTLPPTGFDANRSCHFSQLSASNRFLFRAVRDGQASPFRYNVDGRYTENPRSVSDKLDIVSGAFATQGKASFDNTLFKKGGHYTVDALKQAKEHADWTSRKLSQFVSTTFCLAWALYRLTLFQLKAHSSGMKLVVIDASKLVGRAETAAVLLEKAGFNSERLLGYAHSQQEVLVFGFIPHSAILAIVELSDIQRYLPSWYPRARKATGWVKVASKSMTKRQALRYDDTRVVQEAVAFVECVLKAPSNGRPLSVAFFHSLSFIICCWAADPTCAARMLEATRTAIVEKGWGKHKLQADERIAHDPT